MELEEIFYENVNNFEKKKRNFLDLTYLSSTSQASKSFLANGVKKNRQTWNPVSQRLIYLWAVVKAFISFDASDDEL